MIIRAFLLSLIFATLVYADPDWTSLAIQGVRLGASPEAVKKLHGPPTSPPETIGKLTSWDYPAGKPFLLSFDKSGVMTVWGNQLESQGKVILKSGASARSVRQALGEPDSRRKFAGMDAIWFYYRKSTLRVSWDITGVKAFGLEKAEYTVRLPVESP